MNHSTKTALVAAMISVLLIGFENVVSATQSGSWQFVVTPQHRANHQPVQVNDRDNETNDDRAKQQETAKLQSLAKITPHQAQQSAEAALGGKASRVKLENEDCGLVDAVEIDQKEAKVDAGSGKVLYTEAVNHKDKKTEDFYPRNSVQVTEAAP